MYPIGTQSYSCSQMIYSTFVEKFFKYIIILACCCWGFSDTMVVEKLKWFEHWLRGQTIAGLQLIPHRQSVNKKDANSNFQKDGIIRVN